jgi:hypothetical protein
VRRAKPFLNLYPLPLEGVNTKEGESKRGKPLLYNDPPLFLKEILKGSLRGAKPLFLKTFPLSFEGEGD